MFRDALTFDDISLVPRKSTLADRDAAVIDTDIGIPLRIPIVSSPMDTVTWIDMAEFMASKGGVGILHRYCSIESQVEAAKMVSSGPVGAAVGINGDAHERVTALVESGVKIICIDVAHGHNVAALAFAEEVKNRYGDDVVLISGNICTGEAARDYESVGVDCYRVGIGSGSACTTRVVAGVGVPQVTAIIDVREAVEHIPIIADGGIRSSGDIVKALAVGADAVMLGGMLAPYLVSAAPSVIVEEPGSPGISSIVRSWVEERGAEAEQVFANGLPEADIGNFKRKKLFRGMASRSALSPRKPDGDFLVEGEEFLIDIDFDFEKSFDDLVNGIKAGLAYLGAHTIYDARKAEIVTVTGNGYLEGTPHMLRRGGQYV
ncbi:MAG: guanosine monophosphate reductase [Candidatus Caldarchaeum sp.]